MSNRCLIIMPPGEPEGYPPGHVNRVYDYIIVPACRLAGYWPTRENVTHDNPLDVVKEIIDFEIAICDLSTNNTNARYVLAIRNIFGLPVTVVYDMKSLVTFSAKDLDIVQYDESLRIDTVQKTIDALSEAIRKAVATKKERHELLNRLNIGLPPTDTDTSTNETSGEEEDVEDKEVHLPIISPLPDYVGEPFKEQQIGQLKTGDVFFHLNYGRGKVINVKKMGKDKVASIQFESGTKLLVLSASDFFRKIVE